MTLPLYELRDIHPAPIPVDHSSWLLAGGGGLVLVIAGAVSWYWHRRRPWRQARRALAQLEPGQAGFMLQLNEWLKETALLCWPREQIAALHGEAWLAFLDRHTGSRLSRFAHDWSRWCYGEQAPDGDEARALLNECRRYLRLLSRRRSSC